MRIEIKRLQNKKWKNVPVEEILDKTLLDYMETTEDSIVAALFKDDGKKIIISNDMAYVKMYEESWESLHSKELRTLFLGEAQHEINLVAKVFPNSEVKEIGVE